MNSSSSRLVGGIAAALASGVAGFYLWPATHQAATVADRNAAVEVRTQVIRRTVHIVRHRKAHTPTAQTASTVAVGTTSTRPPAVHTASSRVGGAAAPPVATRSSATAGSGSSVVTRSSPSGGEGHDDGGHGDGGDGGGDS